MNINLSKTLIQQISRVLYTNGYGKLWNDFWDMVDASDSKEINYKNYGRKLTMAESLLPIDTTKLNHLSLQRDERGHFLPKYRKLKRFGYHSVAGNTIKIRTIEPTEITSDYIIGRDLEDKNKIKQFRKDRVVGKIQNLKELIY